VAAQAQIPGYGAKLNAAPNRRGLTPPTQFHHGSFFWHSFFPFQDLLSRTQNRKSVPCDMNGFSRQGAISGQAMMMPKTWREPDDIH